MLSSVDELDVQGHHVQQCCLVPDHCMLSLGSVAWVMWARKAVQGSLVHAGFDVCQGPVQLNPAVWQLSHSKAARRLAHRVCAAQACTASVCVCAAQAAPRLQGFT